MAVTSPRVTSTHIPFVPITVSSGSPASIVFEAEALLDTGFDGYVVVPRGTFTNGHPPRQYLRWTLAGGSTITAPAYYGSVIVGSTELPEVVITELGAEAIIGMQVVSRFTLTIDHGRTLSRAP